MVVAAPTLLARLRAEGFEVMVSAEGRFGLRPRAKVTPELDAAIRAHRDELVALVLSECPWPVGFNCPACGTREEHGHA